VEVHPEHSVRGVPASPKEGGTQAPAVFDRSSVPLFVDDAEKVAVEESRVEEPDGNPETLAGVRAMDGKESLPDLVACQSFFPGRDEEELRSERAVQAFQAIAGNAPQEPSFEETVEVKNLGAATRFHGSSQGNGKKGGVCESGEDRVR